MSEEQIIVQVSTAQQLLDAYQVLSNTPGGGRIELTAQAEDLWINLKGGGPEHVTITAADPADPVTISQITLTEVDNVTITGLHVNSEDVVRAEWQWDMRIKDSSNIEISNMKFTSFASGKYDPDDPSTQLAESLGGINGSSNITFANNDVSGYYHGLGMSSSTGITVSGNTFSEMQGDGMRMVAVRDVLIEGNHFHDFHGTVPSFNHNDMIQLWSTGATVASSDITITNNILDAGEGSGTQGIFIRNQTYDGGLDDNHIYTNITITDNLIYNGFAHGITVDEGADGVTVTGNTLLYNEDAGTTVPRITLGKAWNVTAHDNIAGHISLPEDADADNNLLLDYVDTQSPNYVGNHIVNPFLGGDATLDDLRLRADSSWAEAGAGAPDSAPLGASENGLVSLITATADPEDPLAVTFDAGFSVNESGLLSGGGYEFVWSFADGSTQTGVRVTHQFDTPGQHQADLTILHDGQVMARDTHNADVRDPELLRLDFDQGFHDLSSYDSVLVMKGATLVDHEDGSAMRIGGKDFFVASRDNTQLNDLESFGFSIDMTVLDSDGGAFLRFGSTMNGSILKDGTVSFKLKTSDGTFEVTSGDAVVGMGVPHQISIGYSNTAGKLTLAIDGEVVGEAAASGATPAVSSAGFVIGSPFNTVVDALVHDVTLHTYPEAAGFAVGEDEASEEGVVYEAEAVLVSPVTEQSGDGPAAAEEEAVTVEEEAVTVEEEAAAVEEEAVTVEEEVVAAEEEPVTAEEEPVTAEEEPVTAEEEPVTAEEEVAAEEEVVAVEEDTGLHKWIPVIYSDGTVMLRNGKIEQLDDEDDDAGKGKGAGAQWPGVSDDLRSALLPMVYKGQGQGKGRQFDDEEEEEDDELDFV